MPKMKTNSGSKKRFTLTLTKKTKKQKRNLTHFGLIDSVDQKRVKALLAI